MIFFYIYIKISASQIWSSGSFEERLFPEALLSLFLSGGMIFISHLLRSVYYSSLNQHCIICLDHLHLILLRHITGDIQWWLIFLSLYVSICYTVIKMYLIYITSIRISSYKYQHRHQIAYFCWVFSSIFSLYQTIWAIKTWCIKYDTPKNSTYANFLK